MIDGKTVLDFEEEVNRLENGMVLNWLELNALANSFHNVWGIQIIGCKDMKFLRRYKTDQEMYETIEVSIVLVDSFFWEMFSKDADLISVLAEKFKNLKFQFLDSDFEK